LPELLSMNCLMAGMVPVMVVAFAIHPALREPSQSEFWFVMLWPFWSDLAPRIR